MEPQEKSDNNVIDIVLMEKMHNYLTTNELIKISLLNKLTRKKLSPILFSQITINTKKLSDRIDFFHNKKTPWSYSKTWPIVDKLSLNSNGSSDRNEIFKAFCIDPCVNNILAELLSMGPKLRQLIIQSVMKPCYYLFPITFQLISLTKLRLDCCYVSLDDFKHVMGLLKYLVILELDLVVFVEPSELEESASRIQFPQSLTELYWNDCYIGAISLLNKSYEFIFNMKFYFQKLIFEPQALSLTKLTRLYVNNSPNQLQFINDWMTINPGLSKISFNVKSLCEINFNLLSNNIKLKELDIMFSSSDYSSNEITLPNLYSIRLLKIRNITSNHFEISKNFSLVCPNLSELELGIFNYSDEFLIQLGSKLSNLKKLTLCISSYSESRFKISNLMNIQKLMLIFEICKIEEFCLPQASQLKLISVIIYKRSKNLESFINNFENINWKLNVKGSLMSFEPLN